MNNIVKFSDDLMSDFEKIFNQSFLGNWDLPSRTRQMVSSTFPPYNIIENKKTNETIIEIALAGYRKDEIHVSLSNGVLTIKSEEYQQEESDDEDNHEIHYLHNGIAKRYFEWKRTIPQTMEVKEARYEDGLLKVVLVDTKKDDYKKIEIK